MKKLLFLTARLPYPTNSGRKNVMYYYCKYLNELYNYEIINVSFLEKGDDVNLKPDFISKTYVIDKINSFNKLKNITIDTLIKKKKPLQVSLYSDKSINKQLKEIIEYEKPDVLMCDMIRTADYLKDYNIPKILDMDDMLSIRYKRQLDMDIEDVNPYGAFIYQFPKFIQGIMNLKTIKNYVLNLETKLLEEYETNISKKYDSIVFVAEKEAAQMNKKLGLNKAFAVPLGVNIEYFSESKNYEYNKECNSISFLGAMNVTHNESAVIHFCKNILPIIEKHIHDIKFYIIGSGVTEKIKNLSKLNKNIIVVGRVDDIRKYIVKTEVFVCPMLFGSGIKTKNLEAMAMSIPVVTTSVGAESINAIDGKDWYIEDDNEEFAKRVIMLLKNENLRKNISLNGFNYVEKNFDWDNVMKNWNDVIDYTTSKNSKNKSELI